MCQSTKLLSSAKSGEVSLCENCNVYHFMFNNIYFEFSPFELEKLREYLDKLDCSYWENKHCKTRLSKRIPIPTLQNNLILMFNQREITELKRMLEFDKSAKQEEIGLDDIDYQLILN